VQLGQDLFFRVFTRDSQFFNEQITSRIEHGALAKGQLFFGLQDEQVAENSGNLNNGASSDLFIVFSIPPIPMRQVSDRLPSAKNAVDLIHHFFAYDRAKPNGGNVISRDHDDHAVFQDTQDKELVGMPWMFFS
jgi:hypothetical protein